MKSRILGVLVAAAALAGCGGSSSTGNALCDKAVSTSSSLNSKVQACGGNSNFNGNKCTTALASCTEADQAVLNTFLDCLNALPNCTPSTAASFESQMNACFTTQQANISAACDAAINT